MNEHIIDIFESNREQDARIHAAMRQQQGYTVTQHKLRALQVNDARNNATRPLLADDVIVVDARK